MVAESIRRLVRQIAYPEEELLADKAVQTLAIDDYRLTAEVRGGRLVFGWELEAAEGDYAVLADYAAGRLLAEKATLAYDPEKRALLLWQGVPTTAPTPALVEALEDFVNSCDWWSARLDGLKARERVAVPEMVIRP